MKTKLFSYQANQSFIHQLQGATKLLVFLILSTTVMLSYDIRVIGVIFIISLLAFKISNIAFKDIKTMFWLIVAFISFNFVMSYLFAPQYGVQLYQSETLIFKFNDYFTVTWEEVLYLVTKTMKYIAIIPIGMLFFLTTNPSEFASSLNAIGLPYRLCYALSLTLRYFPDILRNYDNIKLTQQARGIELSAKAPLVKRIKHTSAILIPLVFSSLDSIETISNAMDLRGFGQLNKRSWLNYKKLQTRDYVVIIAAIVIFIISLLISIYVNQSRFYNPFI